MSEPLTYLCEVGPPIEVEVVVRDGEIVIRRSDGGLLDDTDTKILMREIVWRQTQTPIGEP